MVEHSPPAARAGGTARFFFNKYCIRNRFRTFYPIRGPQFPARTLADYNRLWRDSVDNALSITVT